MYKVKYTERFEDWYVAESDVFHYETIQSACRGFEQVTRGLLSNSESIEGPRLYIEEVATTLKKGLVVGMHSMPGNPWDRHTLDETIEQMSILTHVKPKTVVVDKGYQGVKIEGVEILRSGQRRVTRAMKAMIEWRSAIEPAIGHMKMDGKLSRNPPKGALGDALHAVMCGAGHNMRMLLRKLRLLYTQFGLAFQEVLQVISLSQWTNYGVAV